MPIPNKSLSQVLDAKQFRAETPALREASAFLGRSNAELERVNSLKMKFATAPFFRCDVGDGFSEVPPMSVEILCVVLTLTIGMIPGLAQNGCAMIPRTLAMAFCIFNANLNCLRMIGHHIPLGDREAAITGFHLDAVIGNSQTNGEAEGF